MSATERFPQAVDSALIAELDAREGELGDVSPDLPPLLTAVRPLLAGGKRYRATFCYW